MTKTRADRRRKHARMIDRAREILSSWGWYSQDDYEKHIRLIAETRKRCDCWMCRNPRHTWKGNDKLTMQERKFNQVKDDEDDKTE